jgi:hypothetical protein
MNSLSGLGNVGSSALQFALQGVVVLQRRETTITDGKVDRT